MKSKFSHGRSGDDYLHTRVGELFEYLLAGVREWRAYSHDINTHFLHVLLFSPGEIQHFIGIFDQNGALRFRLRDINRIREDCDFRFCDFFHVA